MARLPLIALAALLVMALWSPIWAVTALVVMYPLEVLLQASAAIFVDRPVLLNGMVAGLLVWAVVRRTMSGQPLFRNLFTPTCLACLAFFAWGYTSGLWSRTEWAFQLETVRALPYWPLFLILAPMLIWRIEDVGSLIGATMIAGLVIAGLLIVSPNVDLNAARLGIAYGSDNRGNPLELGTLGGNVMLMGALTLLVRPGLTSIGIRSAAVVVGAGLALLSGSRGQLIGAVIAILAMVPINFRALSARGLGLTALAGVLFAGGLMFAVDAFVTQDNDRRWAVESLAFGGSERVENCVDLLAAYAESPTHWLQGLGLYGFASVESRSGVHYTHVLLADALGEGGLIGFSLLMFIIYTVVRTGFRFERMVRHDPVARANVCVLLGLLIYHFILANKQGNMLGNPLLYTFAIMLARTCREYESREVLMEDYDFEYEDEVAEGGVEDSPVPVAT
ncbi:MAG: O-antigen ligase family protein [Phycisphaerales bacterium]